MGIKLGSLVEQYGQVCSKVRWSSMAWPGPVPGAPGRQAAMPGEAGQRLTPRPCQGGEKGAHLW